MKKQTYIHSHTQSLSQGPGRGIQWEAIPTSLSQYMRERQGKPMKDREQPNPRERERERERETKYINNISPIAS